MKGDAMHGWYSNKGIYWPNVRNSELVKEAEHEAKVLFGPEPMTQDEYIDSLLESGE